ncbi:MAG TPA: hypothetical protein VM198_10565 [Longimicrobiales bacterium]|nr:hypothetical protein [Longimicrobiales bacterium]
MAAAATDVKGSRAGPEGRSLVRWTVGSAALWGAAFLAAAVAGALVAGVNPLEHLGPVGALTVIGLTVGALVGPLARGLARGRSRR